MAAITFCGVTPNDERCFWSTPVNLLKAQKRSLKEDKRSNEVISELLLEKALQRLREQRQRT